MRCWGVLIWLKKVNPIENLAPYLLIQRGHGKIQFAKPFVIVLKIVSCPNKSTDFERCYPICKQLMMSQCFIKRSKAFYLLQKRRMSTSFTKGLMDSFHNGFLSF